MIEAREHARALRETLSIAVLAASGDGDAIKRQLRILELSSEE
jgi:hypothetical protein